MYRNEVVIANVPYALNRPYDYTSEFQLDFGMLVSVSFGKTMTYGIVISSTSMEENTENTLKPIDGLINAYSFLSEIQYQLALTMAYQGFCSLGKILVQMIPSFLRVEQPYRSLLVPKINIDHTILNQTKLNVAQTEIIEWLNHHHCDDYHQLIDHYSSNRINTLIKKGVLVKSYSLPQVVQPSFKHPVQSKDIPLDSNSILYKMNLSDFIHGPLLDWLYRSIQTNESVVIIVPSLLSAQLIHRWLQSQIDVVDLYDPGLSDPIKRNSYYRFTHGQTTITVGTKSLLLVKPDASRIIILQAHDGAYLQDNDPRIHVDEVVHTIRSLHQTTVILQTLIPPLSLQEDIDQHKIHVIEKVRDVEVGFIDTKNQCIDHEFAPFTLNLLDQMVSTKKHLVISTSRKGWYYQVQCGHCHQLLVCPSCNHLLHSTDRPNVYYCANCGKTIQRQRCSKCRHQQWVYRKPGVLALKEQLSKRYPEFPIYDLTNDSLDPLRVIDRYEQSSYAILITTHRLLGQIIVHADGLIMLHGDSALSYRQFRNDEWAMAQVMDAVYNVVLPHDDPNRIIQLDHPAHPLNEYLQNLDVQGYTRYELSYRKQMVLPPYSAIALIKIAIRYGLNALQQCIQTKPLDGHVIGPSESQSDQTYRLIVRTTDLTSLQDWLNRWFTELPQRIKSGITISIDPNTMPND